MADANPDGGAAMLTADTVKAVMTVNLITVKIPECLISTVLPGLDVESPVSSRYPRLPCSPFRATGSLPQIQAFAALTRKAADS